MERCLREHNCPFCLSILTKITVTKKPGIFYFQCLACNTQWFLEGGKLIENISNNFKAIQGYYQTEHVKELLELEKPKENLIMRCPFCYGPIIIKKCKETKKTIGQTFKKQSFYLVCQRGCGRGFIPENSMDIWRKTTSLLALI